MIPQRPNFLEGTFLWQVLGYRLASIPPRDLTDPLALEDGNPWIVVAATLERAKRGDFSPLPRLTHVMKQWDDAALWGACSILLGFAGSHSLLKALLDEFHTHLFMERNLTYQKYVAFIFQESMFLWAAPQIAELYLAAPRRKRMSLLPYLISELIEPHRGLLSQVTASDNEYRSLVAQNVHALRDKYGSSNIPVLYGELFSVRKLAQRMLSGMTTDTINSSTFMSERAIFESATGVDCGGFYLQSRLQPLTAAAIVEEFLASSEVAKYEDGVRYFFGHRIPDRIL